MSRMLKDRYSKKTFYTVARVKRLDNERITW